ncbi:MAG: hypothetical protein LBT14_09875 [Treponema sp.]|jgi:hypothetical protein|nr:hypothetical protein [Treponema sp.]
MVNKKFPVKNGLKRVFQTKCGLSLLLAACIFSGCASWPTEGPSGTFTITGIPSEYEGKFVMSSLYIPPEKKAGQLVVFSPKEIARGHATAITNGELKLPLYGKEGGYFGSDTANVCLRLRDTAAELNRIFGNTDFDLVFANVRFEDGVKELKWDDQVAHGFVTIIDLPAKFRSAENTGATVYIRHPDYELKVPLVMNKVVAQGVEGTCEVDLSPPTSSSLRGGTGKFFVEEYYNYRSFPQSGTRDIIVDILTYPQPYNQMTVVHSFFEFKAVPIQDGKITLDLSKGIKQ